MNPVPTLETERLRIRALTAEDLDDCHRLFVAIEWVDPAVDLDVIRDRRASWLTWTIDSYRELAALDQPPYGERAMVARDNGAFLGLIGLVPSLAAFRQLPRFGGDTSPRTRPEVGLFWALSPGAQGKGFATEAAAALINYAFGSLQVERLVATTERENAASIAVMRRLGMTLEDNRHSTSKWPQMVGVLDAPTE